MCSFDKTKVFFAVNDGIYLFSEAGMYSAALHFQESKREGLPLPLPHFVREKWGRRNKKTCSPPFPNMYCSGEGPREKWVFFSSGFVLFSRSHKLYAIVVARSLQFLVAFGKNNIQSSFRCNELAHNSQPKKTTIAPTIFFHKKRCEGIPSERDFGNPRVPFLSSPYGQTGVIPSPTPPSHKKPFRENTTVGRTQPSKPSLVRKFEFRKETLFNIREFSIREAVRGRHEYFLKSRAISGRERERPTFPLVKKERGHL